MMCGVQDRDGDAPWRENHIGKSVERRWLVQEQGSYRWDTVQRFAYFWAYVRTYEINWYGLWCRKLALLRGLRDIVLCNYGRLLERKKHRKCQRCVRKSRLFKNLNAVCAHVCRFVLPQLFFIITDVCEIIWTISKTIFSGGVWWNQNCEVSFQEQRGRWGRLKNDKSVWYDCKQYDVWL